MPAAKPQRSYPFAVMFPSNSQRTDDVPPGWRQRSCVCAVPVHCPIASATRVDAGVLPRNSPGISPDSDLRFLYHGRCPNDTHHRDVVCARIDGSPPRTLLSFTNDSVFDRDQHRSPANIRATFSNDNWHSPVVPWTQISGRVGKLREEHQHHTPDCSHAGIHKRNPNACLLGYRAPGGAPPVRSIPDIPLSGPRADSIRRRSQHRVQGCRGDNRVMNSLNPNYFISANASCQGCGGRHFSDNSYP